MRVYAIVLDDYHVQRMGELRVIEPLLAFVRQLPATDLVAVFYPLDSVTDVAFTPRPRASASKAIRAFYGRRGDYHPEVSGRGRAPALPAGGHRDASANRS